MADAEDGVADCDGVAVMQFGRLDLVAVHKRAVRAVEVLDGEDAVVEADAAVVAREDGVDQADVVLAGAPEADFTFGDRDFAAAVGAGLGYQQGENGGSLCFVSHRALPSVRGRVRWHGGRHAA